MRFCLSAISLLYPSIPVQLSFFFSFYGIPSIHMSNLLSDIEPHYLIFLHRHEAQRRPEAQAVYSRNSYAVRGTIPS